MFVSCTMFVLTQERYSALRHIALLDIDVRSKFLIWSKADDVDDVIETNSFGKLLCKR